MVRSKSISLGRGRFESVAVVVSHATDTFVLAADPLTELETVQVVMFRLVAQ